jgi:Domain of unknown function (DUF4382)
MKIKTKAAVYGLAGLALAGAVVFSGMALGIITPSSTGIVSILLTDPPVVPEGVTAVYITYSSVALHVAGLGDRGWVSTGGEGSVETMGLVNLSQTISSGRVPALVYNLVAFNISSADVEYLGVNYSATVNGGRLIAPIVGGLKINTSNPAAAVVDIQPTVLNLGDQGSPNFVISTAARGVQVPQAEVTENMRSLGNRFSLVGHGWFHQLAANGTDAFSVSGMTLAADSFSFSATNGGADPVIVRMVIITRAAPGLNANGILGSLSTSFVLIVESDGSIQPLGSVSANQARSALNGSGYVLGQGSSHTFSYSGTLATMRTRTGVSSGGVYEVLITGSDALVTVTVTTG